MGYQLWVSPITGYRRKGTRMSDLRRLFETGITANSIQEPLKCCLYGESASAVHAELVRLDFDVAGLRTSMDQPTLEFVCTESLQDGNCEQAAIPIKVADVISESAPLIEVLTGLRDRPHYFILNGRHVSGIITRADLQKPPVRILIFGIVSLLETHLSFVVRTFFPNEKWREVLKPRRVDATETVLGQRKERNEAIDLTDCLQFADKRDLVLASEEALSYLGLESKRGARRTLLSIERVRDKLVHSQDIVSGTTWEELIDVVEEAERMLQTWDDTLEKEARKSSKSAKSH
jgi:hypothetical protein